MEGKCNESIEMYEGRLVFLVSLEDFQHAVRVITASLMSYHQVVCLVVYYKIPS